MKKKTNNNSIDNTNSTNNDTNDNYKWADRLAPELKVWANNPDSLIIEKFYTARDIAKKTFYRGIQNSQKLKDAHEYAMEKLGINREEMCLKFNLSMNSVTAFSLPQYLDRWKKDIEWRSDLKSKQDKDGTVTVNMIAAPKTGKVKPKKGDNVKKTDK